MTHAVISTMTTKIIRQCVNSKLKEEKYGIILKINQLKNHESREKGT